MFRRDCLSKRILYVVSDAMPVDRLPLPVIDLDPSPLHLEDKYAVRRMDENEVCLPVALTPAPRGLPDYRVKDVPAILKHTTGVP